MVHVAWKAAAILFGVATVALTADTVNQRSKRESDQRDFKSREQQLQERLDAFKRLMADSTARYGTLHARTIALAKEVEKLQQELNRVRGRQ